MREIEYYVVSVSGNGGNNIARIGKSLHNIGLDDAVVTPIDPSVLPDGLLRTSNHEEFKGAFKRMSNDPSNSYYSVLHALQAGNGRSRRSTLIASGIPEETVNRTLHALGGHIGNDPKYPEDLDRLYCRLLCTEEPFEEIVFEA